MSGPFSSLAVPASGISVMKTWIDAISDNVANMNTVRPTSEPAFQSRYVVARSVPGGAGGIGRGVQVSRIQLSDGEGVLAFDPNHPFADANGVVRRPNVDLVEQLTNLIVAQRAYQANVTVFERARDSYLRALEIGRT
jgi:flagellar basal-body rod protein FlgC